MYIFYYRVGINMGLLLPNVILNFLTPEILISVLFLLHLIFNLYENVFIYKY
jgi:hypothetical protein